MTETNEFGTTMCRLLWADGQQQTSLVRHRYDVGLESCLQLKLDECHS